MVTPGQAHRDNQPTAIARFSDHVTPVRTSHRPYDRQAEARTVAAGQPIRTEPPEGLKYRTRDERPKTWKEIFGAGQGVGNIDAVLPAGEVVQRMVREYETAKAKLCATRS